MHEVSTGGGKAFVQLLNTVALSLKVRFPPKARVGYTDAEFPVM